MIAKLAKTHSISHAEQRDSARVINTYCAPGAHK